MHCLHLQCRVLKTALRSNSYEYTSAAGNWQLLLKDKKQKQLAVQGGPKGRGHARNISDFLTVRGGKAGFLLRKKRAGRENEDKAF